MSAGDKDGPAFHREGGTLTQARSRGSIKEHEHCSLLYAPVCCPDQVSIDPGFPFGGRLFLIRDVSGQNKRSIIKNLVEIRFLITEDFICRSRNERLIVNSQFIPILNAPAVQHQPSRPQPVNSISHAEPPTRERRELMTMAQAPHPAATPMR